MPKSVISIRSSATSSSSDPAPPPPGPPAQRSAPMEQLVPKRRMPAEKAATNPE